MAWVNACCEYSAVRCEYSAVHSERLEASQQHKMPTCSNTGTTRSCTLAACSSSGVVAASSGTNAFSNLRHTSWQSSDVGQGQEWQLRSPTAASGMPCTTLQMLKGRAQSRCGCGRGALPVQMEHEHNSQTAAPSNRQHQLAIGQPHRQRRKQRLPKRTPALRARARCRLVGGSSTKG